MLLRNHAGILRSPQAIISVYGYILCLMNFSKHLQTNASAVITLLVLPVCLQLQQASEVSQMRGARVISAEDLIFLMRKDKVQLLNATIKIMVGKNILLKDMATINIKYL